ncbi:MAG: lamin tail domain-containing protein [Nanoarchaeota archaeon]|nr:lamin tail domain-containing protein [Nanoarchaeota archaeon]
MNKRKAWLLITAACLLLASCRLAAALTLTEVMYNPTGCDDTDCEWIEIYNNADEPIDLSAWTLNNRELEGTLNAMQYLVIAKELTDATDADDDSFEKYWGNNDGTWDEADGFNAIDFIFSLANSAGIVNLSNGNESDILEYTSAMGANGNGNSLQRTIELGWEEGMPNPGEGAFATALEKDETEFELEIENIPPRILSINITPDEMDADGIQVIAGNKTVTFTVIVKDENSVEDIANITAFLGEAKIEMRKINQSNLTVTYEGSYQFKTSDERKTYNLTITAFDSETNTTEAREIEYVSRIATVLETKKIDFGKLSPGEVREQIIVIRNTGIDRVSISFSANNNNIAIEAFNEAWINAESANIIIEPGEREEIQLRAIAPNKKAGIFKGKLKVIAKAA